MWKQENINFTLYNNRSLNVVKNFINFKDFDVNKILKIEKHLLFAISLTPKYIETPINSKDLNIDCDDVIYTINDLKKLSNLFKENIGKFSKDEELFLQNRNIPFEYYKNFLGVSNFQDEKILDIIGYTLHPLYNKLCKQENIRGIIVPLFDNNGYLINCAIRRINDVGKIKYSLSCPDTDIWGLETFDKNKEVWITEGIFDSYALYKYGLSSLTVSNSIWSTIQLYKLIELNPKKVNILYDNDYTGLKNAFIISKILNLNHIKNETFICKSGKDSAEIIFEKNKDLTDIVPIIIKLSELNERFKLEKDNTNNGFIEYLRNRTF